MKFLIKLAGRFLGRKIQDGSTVGAGAGMVAGGLAGIGLAAWLIHADWIGHDFRIAIYLIACIPLAIAGAVVGATLGPRAVPLDARQGVRLTNYNRAAGSLAIAMIFTSLFVAMILLRNYKPPHPSPSEDISPAAQWGITLGIGALALIAGWVASRETWSVDIHSRIQVRTLLGSRHYTREDVTLWGFEIRANEVVQHAITGQSTFCVQFADKRVAKVPVDGADCQAIIDALGVPTSIAAT